MLTRQQLYELYRSGPERILHFVEQLLSHLAEVERHVGHRQQYMIDNLLKQTKQLTARVERLKARLLKQEMVNYQLTRRIQELQTELARRDAQGSETAVVAAAAVVRRDSHNSGLPPSLDLPGVKAANSIKRTRSLRRKSGKPVGGQVGHAGATLRQVATPDHVQVHEPQRCRRCRASLATSSIVGRQRRQVFDLPPVVLEVTAYSALS